MSTLDTLSSHLTTVDVANTVPDALSKRVYSIPELMHLTGMTRKQVAYWAQIGLVVPLFRDTQAHVGQPALFYSANEVIKALIVCELRRAGFSPRQVQHVARNLEQRSVQLSDADVYLLTDGYSVHFANRANEIVDILRNHRQMLLLVLIHEQVAKLQNTA